MSPAKSLMDQVKYGGKMMAVMDVLTLLHALPLEAALTTSEAAIFLRSSQSGMERMRKDGGGPLYMQGGTYGAKGTNQSCTYIREDLIAWQKATKVGASLQAAVRKGQAFATIFDLAEAEPFYLDEKGNVDSMVEENLVGTVVDRLGKWSIVWMTPIEAASRRWADVAKHKEFAAGVQYVLSKSLEGVQGGVDATDITSGSREVPTGPRKLID